MTPKHWYVVLLGALAWPFFVVLVALVLIRISGNADFWPDAVAGPMFCSAFAGIVVMPFAMNNLFFQRMSTHARRVLCLAISVIIGVADVFLALSFLPLGIKFMASFSA